MLTMEDLESPPDRKEGHRLYVEGSLKMREKDYRAGRLMLEKALYIFHALALTREKDSVRAQLRQLDQVEQWDFGHGPVQVSDGTGERAEALHRQISRQILQDTTRVETEAEIAEERWRREGDKSIETMAETLAKQRQGRSNRTWKATTALSRTQSPGAQVVQLSKEELEKQEGVPLCSQA